MNSSKPRPRRTLATLTANEAEEFLVELANMHGAAAAVSRFQARFRRFVPERQAPFAAVETVPYRDRQGDRSGLVSSPSDAVRLVHERGKGSTAAVARADAVERTAKAFATGKHRGRAPASVAATTATTESGIEDGGQAPRLGPLRSLGPAEQEAEWIWNLRDHLRRVWEQPDYRTREWGVFLLLLATRGEAGSRHLALLGFQGPLPEPTAFEQALMHLLKVADLALHCGNPDCSTPYYFANRRSQKYCSDECALPAQREFKRRWWAEHGAQQRQRAVAKKTKRRR